MDISIQNLSKLYGSQKAVDDISFDVRPGEILGFLGPNGAGKTTTMKAITALIAPSGGQIFLGGISVQENPDEVKKHIGFLPENNPLYADMGVLDYLEFMAEIQGVLPKEIQYKVREMVKVCGLNNEKHKKISELSKGYKQRVGLAQALIHDPDVLILDEPTTGLDPNQIVEIRELIKTIGKSKTVILSSHILAEVEATCDRIIIISNGKIVADGTPTELRKKSKGNEVVTLVLEGPTAEFALSEIKKLETVSDVEILDSEKLKFEIISKNDTSSRKELFYLCVKNNWVLTEMSVVETRLEDVFREVTSN